MRSEEPEGRGGGDKKVKRGGGGARKEGGNEVELNDSSLHNLKLTAYKEGKGVGG